MAADLIHVDFLSDVSVLEDLLTVDLQVVCPWCLVAYKRLKLAAASLSIRLDISWHPFELNPALGADGQDMYEHVQQKYGIPRNMVDIGREQMSAIGREIGFAFRYRDGARIVNTFRLHQILHWSRSFSRKETKLKIALFKACFNRGEDVSSIDVLVGISGRVGLNVTEARAVLEDERFAADVRAEQHEWKEKGITAVPYIVFPSGEVVTQAVSTDELTQILQRCLGDLDGTQSESQ